MATELKAVVVPKSRMRRSEWVDVTQDNVLTCFGEREDFSAVDRLVVLVQHHKGHRAVVASGVVDGYDYGSGNVVWLHSLCIPKTDAVAFAKLQLQSEGKPSLFRTLMSELWEVAEKLKPRKRGFRRALTGMLVSHDNKDRKRLLSIYARFHMVVQPEPIEIHGDKYDVLLLKA